MSFIHLLTSNVVGGDQMNDPVCPVLESELFFRLASQFGQQAHANDPP